MDRDLAPEIVRSRRRRIVLRVGPPIILLVAVIAWLPGWIRPSVDRTLVRTAVVTTGDISASISASGTVVPMIERVMSSPLDARVLRILQHPGAQLKPGDAVVELDLSDSEAAFERAQNDLQVKDNEQRQAKQRYATSLADLDGQVKLKALELDTRRAELAERQQLADKGLLSKQELRTAELAARQAEIELSALEARRQEAGESTALELEGLTLQQKTLDRDLSQQKRLLDLATTRSDRQGVLTWVVNEEGALVHRGDVLARIADLSSFQVDATTSDVHSGAIRPGLPAEVRLDDLTLEGEVGQVYPAVENGTIHFTVALKDSAHPKLRPSLRVDVQVLTDTRSHTLIVTRGPFADADGLPQLFVIHGNRAVRTPVTFGVSSFDAVQVTAGVSEGEEVIISDMRDYAGVKELRLR